MPNDMANRGCRTVPQMGCTAPDAQACARSHHDGLKEEAPCDVATFTRRRWVSTPVVDARILLTRPAGGSTSVRSFSQLRPASTSANSGPHTEQVRAWARKAIEPAAAQNAIERVADEAVELRTKQLVTLHSVTGVVWHHITCL